jgi:hypothetical protein
VKDGIPLRYAREVQRRLYRRMALSLLVLPLGGIRWVNRGLGSFLTGVFIGLAGLIICWVSILLARRGTWYRVRGTMLVAHGLRWHYIDLTKVRAVGPKLWRPWTMSKTEAGYLVLELDGYRIRLGDPAVGTYFEPAGLRALADGLERSPHPVVRGNAKWLRKIARHPDVGSWPLLPSSAAG